MTARILTKEVSFEDLPKAEAVPLEIKGELVEGFQAIRNPDTNHIFCIPTAEYKLVTHQEMIERTEELIHQTKGLGNFTRSIRIDGLGERMVAQFTFHEAPFEFEGRGRKEIINPTINLLNSLDRSWKNQLTIGAERTICTNGLTIGENWGRFKKRHIRSLEFEQAREVLESGFERIQQTALEWKAWGEQQVAIKEVDDLVKRIDFTNKERELLLEEQEVSTQLSIENWKLFQELDMRPDMVGLMTRWTLYNIFTQFTTHQVSTEQRRLQLQNQVTSAFYN